MTTRTPHHHRTRLPTDPSTHTGRTSRTRPSRQDGFASVEFVLITPLLIMFLLLAAGTARLVGARAALDQAALQAARTAALTNPHDATRAGQQAARQALGSLTTCHNPQITITVQHTADNSSELAHVACTVPLADLLLAGFPGNRTLTAHAASPRDPYAAGTTP